MHDQNLLKCTMNIRMNDHEKKELPIDLKIRDNGKMLFPKKSLLPFIRRVNEKVCEFANRNSLIKYGSKMIKKCAEESFTLLQKDEVKKEFYEALHKDVEWHSLEIENFHHEWTCKMIHARMQEFVSSHLKRGKGGHTLRDQLYSIKEKCEKKMSVKKGENKNKNVKKGEKKNKSVKKVKKSDKNESKKKKCDKNESNEKKCDKNCDKNESSEKKCDKKTNFTVKFLNAPKHNSKFLNVTKHNSKFLNVTKQHSKFLTIIIRAFGFNRCFTKSRTP